MHLTRTELEAKPRPLLQHQIVRGLYGDWGLVREWGRIGSPGQVRTDWFGSEAEAKDARFTLHMRKAKRGYD